MEGLGDISQQLNITMDENDIINRIDNGEMIINRLFQNESSKNKPTDEEFVKNLQGFKVNQEFYNNKNQCAICMDLFQVDDICIQLPCDKQPHYFHGGSDESMCSGIKPWLESNNNCPICRCEFPEQSTDQSTDQPTDQHIDSIIETMINNINQDIIAIHNDIHNDIQGIMIQNNDSSENEIHPPIPENLSTPDIIDFLVQNIVSQLRNNINNLENNSQGQGPIGQGPIGQGPSRFIRIPIINEERLIEEEERQLQQAIELSYQD